MAQPHHETISRHILEFRRTRRVSYLLKAAAVAGRQGRCFEIGYGMLCFALRRPAAVEQAAGFRLEDHLGELGRLFEEGLRARDRRALEVSRQVCGPAGRIACRYHGHDATEAGFILGEYGEQSARLFVMGPGGLAIQPYYDGVPGIRHIHVVCARGTEVLVATGDGRKFLDRWELNGGGLEFRERILGRFGGFTACCKANGRRYFGTDFSERPNYIFCYETRRKWFFPRPAYRQLCEAMLPFGGQYIFCVNTSLWAATPRRSVSVFDTAGERFVYCSDYRGTSFIDGEEHGNADR